MSDLPREVTVEVAGVTMTVDLATSTPIVRFGRRFTAYYSDKKGWELMERVPGLDAWRTFSSSIDVWRAIGYYDNLLQVVMAVKDR